MRVLCANNYGLRSAQEGVERGAYPRPHLWGTDALAAPDIEVVLAPQADLTRRGLLAAVDRRWRWKIGDLAQELFVVRNAGRRTVAYAADQTSLRGLSVIRGMRLFPVPIVTVVHHPVDVTRQNRLFVRGIDLAICLSREVGRRLIEDFGRSSAQTIVTRWGPDLRAPFYSPTDDGPVVSAGTTQRDIHTLLAAVAQAEYPVRIFTRATRHPPRPGVEIVNPAPGAPANLIEYMAVIESMRAAAVVAIPLANTDTIVGLTELNDALALGKPVVMTRNRFIDVDVEAVGCGVWVEPGDVQGWRQALDQLMADPGRRRAMGEVGRSFAEREWNYERFCSDLVDAIVSLERRSG